MNAIVFFDGVCGLCNGFVDFLVKRNHRGGLRFATLQGKSALQLLPAQFRENLAFIVFYDGSRLHVKSTGAIRTIATLGGGWQLALCLLWAPRVLRDGIYGFIAHRRYSWFGRRETCRVPLGSETVFFLD